MPRKYLHALITQNAPAYVHVSRRWIYECIPGRSYFCLTITPNDGKEAYHVDVSLLDLCHMAETAAADALSSGGQSPSTIPMREALLILFERGLAESVKAFTTNNARMAVIQTRKEIIEAVEKARPTGNLKNIGTDLSQPFMELAGWSIAP